MAYNTCLRSSAPGRTGRQSDNLLAKFNATLSLEDSDFGWDKDFFAMVPLGGSSRRTPTAVVPVSLLPFVCLPVSRFAPAGVFQVGGGRPESGV
jgi:hypothetical protein